tara:strand:+ start:264 stop:773 length:510 start_codon:yes stop_codon:yes gene_type:complete
MPNDMVKAVSNAVSKRLTSDTAMTTAVDVLYSGGFEARFCKSPKKDSDNVEHKEAYAALKKAVVAGFTETRRKLLDTPTKALSEKQKDTKRFWQQQIGARVGDFHAQLQRREDVANGVTNPRNVKSIETYASETCVALKKRLETAELAEFDTVLALEKLEELATVVNKR